MHRPVAMASGGRPRRRLCVRVDAQQEIAHCNETLRRRQQVRKLTAAIT